MHKLYITEPHDEPVSAETLAKAKLVGAETIYSGVAPILIGKHTVDGREITDKTRGYLEIKDDAPAIIVPTDDLAQAHNLIEQAKKSTNPEVAALAEAITKLLS